MLIKLKPFTEKAYPFSVVAEISPVLTSTVPQWDFCFLLRGDIEGIFKSVQEKNFALPKRMDRLWEGLCFEVFLKDSHTPAYVEMNAAPQGFWNIFQFSSYRLDKKEAPTEIINIKEKYSFDSYQITFQASWPSSLPIPSSHLQVNLCTVIPFEQEMTYWAIAHGRPVPDFHYEPSFLST